VRVFVSLGVTPYSTKFRKHTPEVDCDMRQVENSSPAHGVATLKERNSQYYDAQKFRDEDVLLSFTNPHSSSVIYESFYSRLGVRELWTGIAQSV
jgi:hypothetical protein